MVGMDYLRIKITVAAKMWPMKLYMNTANRLQ